MHTISFSYFFFGKNTFWNIILNYFSPSKQQDHGIWTWENCGLCKRNVSNPLEKILGFWRYVIIIEKFQ